MAKRGKNSKAENAGNGDFKATLWKAADALRSNMDDAGNMTSREDEAGVIVNYTYSDKNQLTERRKTGTTNDVERYTYDALGRMTIAEKGTDADHDAVSKSIFAYDALSRVTSEEQSILGGSSKTIEYEYDKAGRRTEMTLHDGTTVVNFGYDDRDRCNDIDLSSSQLASYDWLGSAINSRTVTTDYPGSTNPTIVTAYTRDGLSRVTKVLNELGTPNQNDHYPGSPGAPRDYGDLGVFNYTYDDAANPLTETQLYIGNNMPLLRADREFEYDTLNRLTSADLTDTQTFTSASTVTSTWAYDDVGNRTSSTHRGGSSVSYTHDDANRMTAVDSSSQTYDDAGNLTHTAAIYGGSSSAYTLVYDHHNRLTQVKDSAGTSQLAAFTWDALGRRIRYVDDTNSTTTDYYYDGVNEVYEYDGSGNPQRYFVHGVSYVDERLAMVNTNGTTSTSDDVQYYYVMDRMYNVRAIVDHAGSIVERYCYDPYGKPLIRQSPGRGDLQTFGIISGVDNARYSQALSATIWDPRADMDDDGDVDSADTTPYNAKVVGWASSTVPERAFSLVGNPYMFQGVPHFAFDTSASATTESFSLNHHRARFAEPVTGRWVTRDPLDYDRSTLVPDHLISGRRYGPIQINATIGVLVDLRLGDVKSRPTGVTELILPSFEYSFLSNYYAIEYLAPTRFTDPLGLCGPWGPWGPWVGHTTQTVPISFGQGVECWYFEQRCRSRTCCLFFTDWECQCQLSIWQQAGACGAPPAGVTPAAQGAGSLGHSYGCYEN